MTDDPRVEARALFDAVAPVYDTGEVAYFSVFARQLVEDLGVLPGDRVLDLGTGAGAVLLAAAERVGRTGTALGVDLSPKMVERAAAAVRERGLGQARAEVGDAQAPDLPEQAYDVVAAAFMAFFLPDPGAAFASWLRLLVPGGRLGVTTFGGDDPRWAWLTDLFGPFAPDAVKARRRADPFTSTERVHGLLEHAGYDGVASTVRVHEVRFADPEQWLQWSHTQGQRADWDFLPADAVDEVTAWARAELAAMAEPDGSVVLRQPVRYTMARRPG